MNLVARLAIVSTVLLSACTHALQVKNFATYQAPLTIPKVDHKLKIGVRPFSGPSDSVFFFNTVVETLGKSPAVDSITTDVAAKDPNVDMIVDVRPVTSYRSSFANFFINFPGFFIFTPAWNGYVYRAEIVTDIQVTDAGGQPLEQVQVPITYGIRHADFNRTIFTGLTWAEVGVLALGGGIYNAIVFDRDAIAPLQTSVKENYGQYVLAQLNPKLQSASIKLTNRAQAALPAPAPVVEGTAAQ